MMRIRECDIEFFLDVILNIFYFRGTAMDLS